MVNFFAAVSWVGRAPRKWLMKEKALRVLEQRVKRILFEVNLGVSYFELSDL